MFMSTLLQGFATISIQPEQDWYIQNQNATQCFVNISVDTTTLHLDSFQILC